MTFLKKLSAGAAIAVNGSMLMTGTAFADNMMPGEGVEVQPLKSSIAEETFQTVVVMKALEELGYDVKDIQEIEYAAGHVAIGNGDATFMADHWNPLHADFYKAAGGAEKIYREGVYSPGALQGYLIDKKTADEYNITNIEQLKDPKIAALFDTNDDGKADLSGCNPGWGCEGVIENHLDAYGLRDTVTHNQGSYSAIIADTITRYKAGESVLYYTWTPYWVSGVLVPGKAWTDENPAAAKLFAIMELSANDISAENLAMRDGEKSAEDIARHADAWIKGHRATFDGWLEEARAAAK